MRVILFTTLLLFSVNGFAFNWKKVTTNMSGDTFYVDVSNIKKHNGLVYFWILNDYLEPSEFGTNSTINKLKVDCGEEKQTWLGSTSYTQSMGRGNIIFEGNSNTIQYPKPKSIRYIVMKFASDNAR